jgi:hypothetical protein
MKVLILLVRVERHSLMAPHRLFFIIVIGAGTEPGLAHAKHALYH